MKLITTLFLALAFSAASAQVQNTGMIHISSSSDILYINYAFTNAATSTLTNNGQLYVQQGLANSEAMTAGTGTLYLAGSANQSVSGSQPFKTYNLVTNNSAGITLNNNLHVTNLHTFTSGIITTSATPNYLVYESGSSYTGIADNRHVNGWVKKIGSTAFAFPVGNGLVERRVTVTNLSATSEFNVKHNMPTLNPTSRLTPITSVDGSEYWAINRISGGTAQISMNWDNSKVSFPQWILSDIRAVYYNGTAWANQGGTASGDVSTTGTITSNTMSAFGNFTFGSLSAVLPVNFLTIWGEAKNTYNTIHWKTTDEHNIARFEIQRSSDGSQFAKIGEIAANNTAGIHEYQINDVQPLPSGWYRVKNVDNDGGFKYSTIIKISSGNSSEGIYVLNTFVSGAVQIGTTGGYEGSYQYQLLTTGGQVAQRGSITLKPGSNTTISLNSNLVKSVYILNVFNAENKFQERIFIR